MPKTELSLMATPGRRHSFSAKSSGAIGPGRFEFTIPKSIVSYTIEKAVLDFTLPKSQDDRTVQQ